MRWFIWPADATREALPLQGLFGRGWADLAIGRVTQEGEVGPSASSAVGHPLAGTFVLAPKESTYACSTTGPGRGLGFLPRAGADLWGVLCSAEAGQLAFPQTALHHPSVELYRGGPCTGLPLDPAPQPASVLRAPRLRSHLGMRPWRCSGRGVGKKQKQCFVQVPRWHLPCTRAWPCSPSFWFGIPNLQSDP